jgi:hypothetical protein
VISKVICGLFAIVLLPSTPGKTQSSPKLNNLIVYGSGISFGVKEPDGWQGDTDKIASKYKVNVVFLLSEESQMNDVTIRVRISGKQDENTVEDLNYDMQGIRRTFPMQNSSISVSCTRNTRRLLKPSSFQSNSISTLHI